MGGGGGSEAPAIRFATIAAFARSTPLFGRLATNRVQRPAGCIATAGTGAAELTNRAWLAIVGKANAIRRDTIRRTRITRADAVGTTPTRPVITALVYVAGRIANFCAIGLTNPAMIYIIVQIDTAIRAALETANVIECTGAHISRRT